MAPLVAVALFGLMAAFATSAHAMPTKTTACSGCHTQNAAVVVGAAQTSNNGTTASYTISVNNPLGMNGWAVFNGATKVGGAAGAGGTVALNVGTTYTVYGVSGNGNGAEEYNSIQVTPVAPVDNTAPTTSSDAKATYVSSATIHLSAIDTGFSGVAHTYYILDGGTQTEGTTISTSVIGSHTLEFWSVDVAANVETPHKTANFEITAPVPDTTAPVTTSDAKVTYVGSASIKLTATDNIGGSGVAHTYYILDGGTQTEGTTVGTSVVGTHTVEFWSEDASANVETPHNTANFAVTAAPPVVVVAKYKVTIRINLNHKSYKTMKAYLVNKTTGARFTAKVDRKGYIVFKNVPAGSYKLSVTGKKFKFKTRTVNVGSRNVSVRFK
jgi:hypothetical protein